jgi:hypothetical protein
MSANTIWIATAAVHRLPIHLHGLQLPLDFFVDFLQFFLGEFLHGPSDNQTTIVGFRRFRDDVEVDVRNDLGDHWSVGDCKYQKFYDSHLVSNFSVVLTDQGTLVGSDTKGEGKIVPGGCCNSQVRMRRRSSSQQSENPRDTRLGYRGASRHALRNASFMSRVTTRKIETRNVHLGITIE